MNNNRACNILKISNKTRTKYAEVKEGEMFLVGDLVHLIDDEYVQVGNNNPLLKQKITKYSKVLRKK